ncbi:MAG: hypothetical protein IKW39_01790 [Alphaproteobacteria bacterium]|nr:hypothetical protein [Alphaproteobacteria bacterium]
MPFLTIYTNAENSDNAKLAEEASVLVANVLHKPINYVVTNVIYNSSMAFGGSANQKGALVELLSIGFNNKDKLVEDLTDFLIEKLNIAKAENINISLNDASASLVASAGRTFG